MRRNREEMFALMKAWECSQEPQDQFCKHHGVSLATFSYWRTKYRRENSNLKPTPSGFIELEPQLVAGLEIYYPNGVRIRLPQGSSLVDLQALIQLV